MLLHPTCEPIDLPVEKLARVECVSLSESSPLPAPFLHFHDVAEFILFGTAHGEMICDGKRFNIKPGSAAIVPSMRYHDFVLQPGARDWILIQVDSYLVERTTARAGFTMRPDIISLDPSSRKRLHMLANWLDEALQSGDSSAHVEAIVSLMVTTICKLPASDSQVADNMTTDIDRFLPAIEHLRRQPRRPLPLKEAATLCNLSPAYFSRRFAAVFGCGFADYVASYRLHLAARHVATTSTPFSTISYELGFASPSHFAERYRQRFGVTPREYRHRVHMGRNLTVDCT